MPSLDETKPVSDTIQRIAAERSTKEKPETTQSGFDPDAYLAATEPTAKPTASSFDPDAYLKATEPAKSQTEKKSSWYGQLAKNALRQTGLFTREAVGGLASTLDIPNAVVSAGTRGINAATGANLPVVNPAPMRQSYEQLFDVVGLPKAETPTERVVGAAIEGAMGAGGTASIAGHLARIAASPAAKGVFTQLAASPGLQTASGATGAASGQSVAEHGGGQGEQLAASLAGSLAPSIPSALSVGAKTALRGTEENVPAMIERTKTFREAGATTPSAGQVTGSRAAQGIESALSKIPGGAGPMAKAAERQAEEIGAKATQIADQLSTTATPATAGRIIENGISGEDGFISRFKQGQKALYDKLDEYLPQTASVDISNTKKTLAAMNSDIPNAPALSKWFKNAKIQGIESAIKQDTAPQAKTLGEQLGMTKKSAAEPVQQTAPVSRETTVDPLYDMAIDTANKSGRASISLIQRQFGIPFERAEKLVNKMESDGLISPANSDGRHELTVKAQLKGTEHAETPQTKPSETQQPKATSESITENRLPYESIKKLRSLVGAELDNPSLASDVPRSQWKRLYASLSQDLDNAATGTGNPAAVKAMNRANAFTKAGYDRIDSVLDKVVGKNKLPEDIFKSATSTADMQAGATKIASVMKSLQPAERDVVKSAFIRRMGQATAGQQNAAGSTFSTQTFLTNWNKISPQAKAVLFGGKDGELRNSLDKIAKASEYIKEGSKVFANPSGTAQATALTAGTASVATAVATGQVHTAALLLGGIGASNLTAKMMTNPKFVSWLAKSTELAPAAIPAAIGSLTRSMESEPDDVKNDVDSYTRSIPKRK